MLAFPAAAVLNRGAPPNYRLDATVGCLRAKGYSVALHDRRSFSVKQKSYGDLGVYFAQSVALARRRATADNSFKSMDYCKRNHVRLSVIAPAPEYWLPW